MARLQKIMIGHGLLVMLVAMLAGFMLIFKLLMLANLLSLMCLFILRARPLH